MAAVRLVMVDASSKQQRWRCELAYFPVRSEERPLDAFNQTPLPLYAG